MNPKLKLLPDALTPQVLAHRTQTIAVGHELASLAHVVEVDALEATLFYCGRILEGLASDSVERMGLDAATLVFDNLSLLEELGQLSGPVALFAHALRRHGNDARHLRRTITEADAEVAASLTARWLGWYFCEFVFGPRLPALTQGSTPLLVSPHQFDSYLASAENGSKALLDSPGLWLSPTPVCVALRQLIDADHLASARQLLEEAKRRFPRDLLVRQISGLLLSRSGQLDEALATLDPLAREGFDDEETGGILAGVHKRLWRDGGQKESLEKSRRLYAKGWARSGRKNTYLGINAATLALMGGDTALAQQTAVQLSEQLQARRADIERRWGDRAPPYDPWERATLAESLLIQKMIPQAREQYRLARETMSAGGWRSARRQAELILDKLNVRDEGDFLAEAEPRNQVIRVGITGHRALAEPQLVEEQIERCLRELMQGKEGATFILSSALAAGADQLAAKVALDRLQGRLHAILPLEIDDYANDFDARGMNELRVLLARASSVTVAPKGLSPREAAYEWSGQAVVKGSDFVIACWDGRPPRGRGGTAEIVAFAQQRGVPVIRIDTKVENSAAKTS